MDSILEHKSFCVFLFEYDHLDYELGRQLLEIYGEDPDRLVNMWSWAKASHSLGHVNLCIEPSDQHDLNVRSFHRQLKVDGQSLLDRCTCMSCLVFY